MSDSTGRPPAEPIVAQRLHLRKRQADELRGIISNMVAANQETGFADERLLEYEATLEPNDLSWLRSIRGSRLFNAEGRVQLLAAHLDHFLPTILFYTYPLALRKISGLIGDLIDVPRRNLEVLLKQKQMESADDEVVRAVLSTFQDLAKKADKTLPDFLSTMESGQPEWSSGQPVAGRGLHKRSRRVPFMLKLTSSRRPCLA